jgi:hypothetical protein
VDNIGNGYRPPGELLQVAITVAGIAVALAAIRPESEAAPFFRSAGLISLVGSAYAMSRLWQDAGLGPRDLFPHRGTDLRYLSLLFTAWGMILLALAYAALPYAIYS